MIKVSLSIKVGQIKSKLIFDTHRRHQHKSNFIAKLVKRT